jgi:hypothetical protein
MAQFLVRNSLNPNKVVKLGLTFQQVVPKGAEGEPIWVVEVGTNEPHKDGGSIPPEYIHLVDIDNLDKAVKVVAERISKKINWEPLIEDTEPPFVDEVSPSEYNVSIYQDIQAVIKEKLPAAGIDIDTIQMTVNDIDVTDELQINGDPYEYRVRWVPGLRFFQQED